MNKHVKILLVILGLFSFNQAWANHTVCKSGSTERHIEVVAENAQTGVPCEVRYTKDGETSVLWNAQNDASYCAKKGAELLETLSNAGWNCSDTGEHAKKQSHKNADAKDKKYKHKDGKTCEKCKDGKTCEKCKDKVKEGKDKADKMDAKAKREARKAERKAKREARKAERKAKREARKAKKEAKEQAEDVKKEVKEETN